MPSTAILQPGPSGRRLGAAAATAVLVAPLALLVATGPAAAAGPATATPFVSELHYDNAGADTGEFVEIQAPLGSDLSAWTLVLYNGTASQRAPYDTVALGLVNAPAGDPSGDGVLVLDFPSNGIQNGAPDGLALVDETGTVVEFLSYEGAFTAASGPAEGLASTDIGVAESGSTPVGYSLQRVDGEWTAPAPNTRGVVNGGDPGDPGGGDPGDPGDPGNGGHPDPGDGVDQTLCDAVPSHTIMAVQGSGNATELTGQVTVAGVVTGDVQPGQDGFFLQDPTGDGDPATSDGVFVFAPDAPDVSLGDALVVRGEPTEFFGLTQLDARDGALGRCATGLDAPPAATLPFPSTDAEREPFEGMLVTPSEPLTVSGLFQLERFGEVRLSSGGLLVQGTEAAAPGAPAAAVEAANRTREIVLDDGDAAPLPPYLTVDDSVRIGDIAELGANVLSFGFDRWRLVPASGEPSENDFLPTNPRTPAPEAVGGDVRLASFNVLNYFVTLDDGTPGTEPARGARSPEQFERQQAKIVNALVALDADIVALQEIEYGAAFGTDPDNALAALVAALNDTEGAEVWDHVRTPDYFSADPDVIQNGIVYRPGAVTPVGDAVSLGADLDAWDNAREPVAQRFRHDATGDELVVVGNHFKSKGSAPDTDPTTDPNADQGDGQGAWNADRTLQAAALRDAVAAFAGAEPDVVILGDLNSYGEEDPLTTLEAAGYGNVIEGLDTFTYRFSWRNGNLDHALLSPAAQDKLSGVTIWQVNAAEPDAYTYFRDLDLYAPFPYRASDHNPIVLGLDLVDPLADLGTTPLADVPLADLDTGGEPSFDDDGKDFDILTAAVLAVLAEKPDSAVSVLLDGETPVTAFLPRDFAFVDLVKDVTGSRPTAEAETFDAVAALGLDAVEDVLLFHVVPGAPLDVETLEGLDERLLPTALGGAPADALLVRVETNRRGFDYVTLADRDDDNGDAVIVKRGLNDGNRQQAVAVNQVLLPVDL